MTLDVSQLSGALAANFANPADDAAGCGKQWADAVKAYAAGVVPPSAALGAAASDLEGALAGAFASPSAIGGMESGFAAFGVALAGGMAPTFVGTPPAGPVGFSAQFATSPPPETHEAAAGAIAAKIHAWMQTGTAALAAPPNTVTPWS